MVQRDISGPILRTCYAATRKGVTPSTILNMVLEELSSVQLDMDKCGDMDSHYYYEGMSDAYHAVANAIAPLKPKKHALWMGLLSMQSVPQEVVL